jgi:transposase
MMLEGMLWVMGRGASWRELPEQFGKWNTVYCRYRKWRNGGIWQRILDIVNADHPG